MPQPFLTAHWRYLAMLNYTIDPAVLRPLVPAGVELDEWNGKTFASMVGFLFLDTRVLGAAIPFHRNFEEVNLRFYVRRREPSGSWRRGVVFVKEIVPKPAIAWTARLLYGEKYVYLPMRHRLAYNAGAEQSPSLVEYTWRQRGQWCRLGVRPSGSPHPIADGSAEEFITEHYWGYASHRGHTVEYQVEHPRWRVWQTSDCWFECDVAGLYGSQFTDALTAAPNSAFLAEGSAVVVRQGDRLPDMARSGTQP